MSPDSGLAAIGRMRGSMKLKRFINVHTILLMVFILMIGGVVYRIFNWGVRINPNEIEIDDDRPDTLDLILPLVDEDGNTISDSNNQKVIVCFGNAPFADNRDSSDNLANIIARKTGATVYNFGISNSFLAARNYTLDTSKEPLDVYNFYWMIQTAVKGPSGTRYLYAAEALGEDTPPHASEICEQLYNMDFTNVDVAVIMYDASDYLAGHEMYNDSNSTDIEQFTGNLEAGIELLQNTYPWIRIIVMSPAYAYAVDEDGNYISSDMYTYGQDVLSTYAIKQQESCSNRSVTFIDHIYGTITEDNADSYLIDNLHINTAGKELIADRFVYALNYYNE